MSEQDVMAQLAAARPAVCEQTDRVLDEAKREAMFQRIIATPRTAVASASTHPRSRRTALIASAAAVTVLAGAVGVGLAVTGGSNSKSSALASGAVIKAHLLSALDTSNDIIETATTWNDGSSLIDWTNAAGTIDHLTQTGWPDTLKTVNGSDSTFVAIYPATKTWMTYASSNTEPPDGTVAEEDLRSRVQSGTLSLIATNVEINGQNTTEVLLTDPPLPASADSDLWVNSATDLPVREASPGSTDGETNWTYYAPDSGEASNLAMPIPAGYTQVPVPASAIIPPGGKFPIKIWNGTTQVNSAATCPPGGPSCLIYPPTLPLPSTTRTSGSTGASGDTGSSGTTGATPAP